MFYVEKTRTYESSWLASVKERVRKFVWDGNWWDLNRDVSDGYVVDNFFRGASWIRATTVWEEDDYEEKTALNFNYMPSGLC